jgi:hypothetical protein
VNETASISAAERRRFAAIVFVTELQFFQRVFDTVELTGNQWLICIGAALTDRRRVRDPQVSATPPRARGDGGAGAHRDRPRVT